MKPVRLTKRKPKRGGRRKGAGRPRGEPTSARGIRLLDTEWRALDATADDLGVSASDVIRDAVATWIEAREVRPNGPATSEVRADVGPDGARITLVLRGPGGGYAQELQPAEAIALAERLLAAVAAVDREVS